LTAEPDGRILRAKRKCSLSTEKKHIVDTVHLGRSFALAALSDLPQRDSATVTTLQFPGLRTGRRDLAPQPRS